MNKGSTLWTNCLFNTGLHVKKPTFVSQSGPILHDDLVLKPLSDLEEPLPAPQTDWTVDPHDTLLAFRADALAGV